MRLSSEIRFIDINLKKSFYKLRTSNLVLYNHISNALDEIEFNAFCGIQIPKKQIPKKYLLKYNVKNLWKCNLPDGWRLLYSIEGEEIIVISLILEWLNHKKYENRFNY